VVCRKQMKAREEKEGYLRRVGPTKVYSVLARSTSLLTLVLIIPFRWFMPAASEVCCTKAVCLGNLPLFFFYFDSHFQEGCEACPPLRALLQCFCLLPIACLGLLLDSKMLRIIINRKIVCSFILFTQLPQILLCLNLLYFLSQWVGERRMGFLAFVFTFIAL